ncbi:MAG: transcriptional regulator [Nitrososphaerota archaeon]|nr:transcriptional regulator [Nitrososphaerota archaeon]
MDHRSLAEDSASKFYRLVAEHGKDGVLQRILWKELGLSSRDGSRLAIRLENQGIIRRQKILDGDRWTYVLSALRIPANFKSIEQCPCTTCPYESKCAPSGILSPLSCPWIVEWAINEFRGIQMSPQVVSI